MARSAFRMQSLHNLTKAELIARIQSLESFEGIPEGKTRAPKSKRISQISPDEEGTTERLRAILQTAVEGIITISEKGTIESVNPAAQRMFGYRPEELIGKQVNILMPSPYKEEHDGYIKQYVNTGHAKIIGIGREVIGKRKDGSVFPINLAISEVKLKARRIFTGFLRDISEQKNLEHGILKASENEQRRIGQDLHDGLCQQLAGIEFMSRALEQRLAIKSPSEAAAAANISKLMRQAISHTRNLARGLSPVILEPEGLMAGLKLMAENIKTLFRINCSYSCTAAVLLEDNTVATHLFRIAQEAVNNAIRHGKAKAIRITLSQKQERIILAVEDDGCGISESAYQRKSGMGLRIMQYRAGMIGGSLVVQKGQNGGTSMVCSIHRSTSSNSIN